MRKASDFLSKPLISLNEGRNEGVIKNISFGAGLKTAQWLVLYDENDCDCDEKAVLVSEAYSVGENAVMIKSGQAVVPAVSAPLNDNNPINCRIFTALGKLIGVVSDVILTDDNNTAQLIYDKDKVLPLSDIVSSSRDIVVKCEGGIKIASPVLIKKVPAPRPADTKRKVKALSKEKVQEQTANDGQIGDTDKGQEQIANYKLQITNSDIGAAAQKKDDNTQAAAKEYAAKENKEEPKKPAARKKSIKKNESAGVKTETVKVTAESVIPDAVPETLKTETPGPETLDAETLSYETFKPETDHETLNHETLDAGTPKFETVDIEKIVIKPPQPEPALEDPYKAYDALSVSFSDPYRPEIFVYGADNSLKKKEQPKPRESNRKLGTAVPIKKNNYVSESFFDPVAPLVYDTGGRIEIWPLELDHIPERIIASYSFLLGRRVAKNIYNAARQLVIKADSAVTPQIVETARKYGRLVDLTKLSI